MSESLSESLEKFNRTLELLTKNKISKKNAFENRIIDSEGSLIIPTNLSSNEDSWNYSSSIVEAHGKVFGYCVDYIHEEANRMLGGVKRTSEPHLSPEAAAKRPIKHGSSTLEPSESNLNEIVVNKKERFDSYFNFIKYKFDCGMTRSLLINNVATNSVLDLVFDENDLVIGNEEPCTSSEVNLEGIVTFSVNEILNEPISTLIERVHGQKDDNSEGLHDILDCVDNTQAFIEHELESESEKAAQVEEFHEFNENNFQLSDKISDPLFNLQTSTLVHRIRDYITSNLSKPRKRPKLKEAETQDSDETHRICRLVLSIKEDQEGMNRLKIDTKLDNFYTTKLRPKLESLDNERGYSESRLSRLFTRPGTSSGRFSQSRDPYFNNLNLGYEDFTFNSNENIPEPPLSLDPNLYLPETFNSVAHGRIELNLKFLKSKIHSMLKTSPQMTFQEVISELSRTLPENQSRSLSVHACFIVFLHLANENDLVFQKTGPCDFSSQTTF